MKSLSFKSSQTGMTLIEILIALLVGAFLIGGVIQIFLGTKQSNRMQEGLSRLQENGRFAMDFISNDIRMAGFLGCNNQATITSTLNSPTGFLNNFANAIDGFEATSVPGAAADTWSPGIDAEITSPLGGSDAITIRRAGEQNFSVTAHAANADPLTLDATATTANLQAAGFLTTAATPANNCGIAVVTDCSTAAVFQISGIDTAARTLSHATGGACALKNSTDDLGRSYPNAQVHPINTVSYYIREGVSGQPSLYRRVGSNDAEELVEGIEQMQVLYGEDLEMDPTSRVSTDYVPNYYVTRDDVVDMARVVSVRISLLARTTEDNLAATNILYNYNGTNGIDPGDRRLRRVINSTILIRNRMP